MMIVDGSLTFASAPSLCSKKIAAIGETYSCEKRQSVRTNPVSPGCTHGTPNFDFAASTTQRRAKIFSAIVIARFFVCFVALDALDACVAGSFVGRDVAIPCAAWFAS